MHIHMHYAEAAVKPRTSKIVVFKEYLENLLHLRPPELDSSSENEKQEEEPEDEAAVTTVQHAGEGDSDAPKRDFHEAPLAVLTNRKENWRLMILVI